MITFIDSLKPKPLGLQSMLMFDPADDIDNDETACILANLIYLGRIKGYISHQHNKLVVSKQNAFPSLSAAS